MRLALVSVLVACAAGPLAAQQQTAPSSPIESLALSRSMYDEGVARGDVYLILGAASLRRSVPLDPAEGSAEAQVMSWTAMLDTATALAAADPALLGVIGDLRAARTRGVTSGALFRNAVLVAGAAAEFDAVSFDGASAAEVYVEGIEAADLNLFVYDAAKTLVCADQDTSYIAHCFWQPDATGTFVIKVVNDGAITSSYALITN